MQLKINYVLHTAGIHYAVMTCNSLIKMILNTTHQSVANTGSTGHLRRAAPHCTALPRDAGLLTQSLVSPATIEPKHTSHRNV